MIKGSILNPKYVFSEVFENWSNTKWWQGRIEQRINAPVQSVVRPRSNATNVLDRDWSTLIVLDACHADLFEEAQHQLTFDESSSLTSLASSTPEWLNRTFSDSHGDLVYIAGNPMVSRYCPAAFHELIEVWRDAYDSDTSIVDPSTVTTAALNTHSDFPHKRIIVHYMQPHYPFIDRPELNYADFKFEDIGLQRRVKGQKEFGNVWEALQAGVVDSETVWEGYRHNLNVVMEEVAELVGSIQDRVAITSDHGNMLGGRAWPIPLRTYGHPENQRLAGLTQVPWAVVDGKRRTIRRSDVNSTSVATNEEVAERLSDLGYVQ